MLVGGGEVCAGNVGSAVCYCVGGCIVELDGEAAWWRGYSWIPYFFCLGAVGEEPPISLALGTADDGGVVGGVDVVVEVIVIGGLWTVCQGLHDFGVSSGVSSAKERVSSWSSSSGAAMVA